MNISKTDNNTDTNKQNDNQNKLPNINLTKSITREYFLNQLKKRKDLVETLFFSKDKIKKKEEEKNPKIKVTKRTIKSIIYKKPSELIDEFEYKSLDKKYLKKDLIVSRKISKMTLYEKMLYYKEKRANSNNKSNNIIEYKNDNKNIKKTQESPLNKKNNNIRIITQESLLPKITYNMSTEQSVINKIKNKKNKSKSKKKHKKSESIKQLRTRLLKTPNLTNPKLNAVKTHKKKSLGLEPSLKMITNEKEIQQKLNQSKKEKKLPLQFKALKYKDKDAKNIINTSEIKDYSDINDQLTASFELKEVAGFKNFSIYGICECNYKDPSFNIATFAKDFFCRLLVSHITYIDNIKIISVNTIKESLINNNFSLLHSFFDCLKDETYFYYHMNSEQLKKFLSFEIIFIFSDSIISLHYGLCKTFILNKVVNDENEIYSSQCITQSSKDGNETIEIINNINNAYLLVIGSSKLWIMNNYNTLFKLLSQNESLENLINKLYCFKEAMVNDKKENNIDSLKYSIVLIRFNQ